MNDNPDNSSRVKAEEVIAAFLPIPTERGFVLKQLLASADFVNSIAPNAWAVTLFNNGFRLNVGQVEAIVFIDGAFRVNLVGRAGTGAFAGSAFAAASYHSLPQPLCAFVGSVRNFVAIEPSLRSSHRQFLRFAASTNSGQPRKGTPFRRSHCQLLIDYARSATSSEQNSIRSTRDLGVTDQDEYFDLETPKAREGYELDRIILARGRNARLAAKRKVLDDYSCQACNFKLQLDGKFIIEVHHTQPISTTGETETTIEQLVSLCPTCHRIAHLRSTPYPVEEIREILTRERPRK